MERTPNSKSRYPQHDTPSQKPAAGDKRHIFPPTRWSAIAAIRKDLSEERKAAIDFLAQEYWKPIFIFVRSLGANEDDAQDLVQGFFVHALERNLFSLADREQGRFRNFICTSVKHYVYNEWRGAKAAKRTPPGGVVSIHDSKRSDGIGYHSRSEQTPDDAFDRAWMEGLIERAAKVMENEYEKKGMSDHYTVFAARFLNPVLRVAKAASYAQLAQRLELTAKKIDTYMIGSRRRFRFLVKAEIEKYAKSEKAVREELDLLFKVIGED